MVAPGVRWRRASAPAKATSIMSFSTLVSRKDATATLSRGSKLPWCCPDERAAGAAPASPFPAHHPYISATRRAGRSSSSTTSSASPAGSEGRRCSPHPLAVGYQRRWLPTWRSAGADHLDHRARSPRCRRSTFQPTISRPAPATSFATSRTTVLSRRSRSWVSIRRRSARLHLGVLERSRRQAYYTAAPSRALQRYNSFHYIIAILGMDELSE